MRRGQARPSAAAGPATACGAAQIREQIDGRGLGCERVLAAALRMLDIGVFRVGGEEYAPGPGEDEGSFGLATVRREHVRLRRGGIELCYPAKSGIKRAITLRDPALYAVVRSLLRRQGGGEDLLAAVALAEGASGGVPTSQRGRVQAINAALDEVAEHLGNTRAVARASYVDPRVLEHYVQGRTILAAVRRAGTSQLTNKAIRTRLESALLRLLRT
ncbi:MAG: hypothetical protein ACRDQY_03060 [Pseudonocardiaceae bacterium]